MSNPEESPPVNPHVSFGLGLAHGGGDTRKLTQHDRLGVYLPSRLNPEYLYAHT